MRSTVAMLVGLWVVSWLSACAAVGVHPQTGSARAPDPLDRLSAAELYALGVQLSQAGDSVRAEQYLAAALDRGYPEAQALPALISLCLRQSRLRSALLYGIPYLERHPDDVPLRYLLAAVLLGLVQPDRAYAELGQVLIRQPAHASALYLRAVTARDHLRDAAAARADFTRYLKVAPDGIHADEAQAFLRVASADDLAAAHSQSPAQPSPESVLR